MTDECKAADVYARVARAMIRTIAMQALNYERHTRGHSMAYDEAAFLGVIEDEGIGHDAVGAALEGETA